MLVDCFVSAIDDNSYAHYQTQDATCHVVEIRIVTEVMQQYIFFNSGFYFCELSGSCFRQMTKRAGLSLILEEEIGTIPLFLRVVNIYPSSF